MNKKNILTTYVIPKHKYLDKGSKMYLYSTYLATN